MVFLIEILYIGYGTTSGDLMPKLITILGIKIYDQ